MILLTSSICRTNDSKTTSGKRTQHNVWILGWTPRTLNASWMYVSLSLSRKHYLLRKWLFTNVSAGPPSLLELARDCCKYEAALRPSFADILPRLDGLFANLPDEEKDEMQRLLKISQEKVEEIKRESEKLAMEKLKNRLLEASNKLDSTNEFERRRKRMSQPAVSAYQLGVDPGMSRIQSNPKSDRRSLTPTMSQQGTHRFL